MDRRRLHELLRLRADCLRVPDSLIERALSRAARSDLRQTRNTGRLPATTPPSGSQITVPSLGDAPEAGAITVPSLAEVAAPVPRGQLAAGRIIAGYRIESLLGKGGMGSVYRAHQLSMDRPIAFKVLAPRLAEDPTFVGRFKREARAAGRLHHPNLITAHEAGEADGLVFFSMELVEGHSLKDMMKERQRVPSDEALPILRQVLEALAYAHGRGVIHRDIKPDNIMVAAGGRVKLADLGLSRIEDPLNEEETDLFKTSAGSFMGTPHYMAPEQGRDAHTVDARADLYSLGATLYHLICGKPPFEGGTAMEVLMAAQTKPLVFPEPQPPVGVRTLIARLMEKDPDRRPQDATAALVMLEKLLAPTAAAQPQPWRSLLRRLLIALAWVGSIALAVVLVLGALRFVHDRERTRQWNADLLAAKAEANGKSFPEALDRLGRARAGLDDGDPRAEVCDHTIATITKAWDDWGLTRLTDSERLMRGQARDRHYTDARDTLRKVPPAWRSPAVERRLDALHCELDVLVEKDVGHTPSEPREQHEKKRRIAEWWQRASLEPPQSFRIEGGALLLTGSGSGRLPIPMADRPLLGGGGNGLELGLAWRNSANEAQARWELQLSPEVTVVSTPAGTELRTPRRTVPLPVGSEGWPVITLRRIGPLAIDVRDQDGQRMSIPLRQAGTEPAMSWQLGSSELTIYLSQRGR